LTDGAWQAARPSPVRLVTDVTVPASEVGLPPLSSRVTRRAEVRPPPMAPAPMAPAPPPAPRRRWRVVAAATSALLLIGATGMWASGGLRLPGTGDSAIRQAPAGSQRRQPSAGVETALEGEMTVALERIARARAAAFSSLSPAALRVADDDGSPAERADLALIGRLREGGHRLDRIRYQVSQVRVLGRTADTVRLWAVVTTSTHRRMTRGTSVVVPQEGPRGVVLTVVPAPEGSGPSGWRVRSVEAAT
jgi:hypothetical protein